MGKRRRLYGISLTLWFCIQMVTGQSSFSNQALCLDGKDNNVRTGIGILKAPWTLEAWIQGDDTEWKETEVIFGGGEYSAFENVDYLPVVIRKGRLSNTKAKLVSSSPLDDRWHHVALTCDGKKTCLYLDGNVADSRETAFAVLPGAIGVNETEESVFGGRMDEVRVWKGALEETCLQNWKNRPLSPAHPAFSSLIAYYNFDEGLEESAVNWVGRGHHSYHLRNGRIDYNGTAPFASTVPNDNPEFQNPDAAQSLFNAFVLNSEWDVDVGTAGEAVCKLRVIVTGSRQLLRFTGITLDLSATTRLKDLSAIHIYYAGKTARSRERRELFGSGAKPGRKMTFHARTQDLFDLSPGVHYFLVTADVREQAVPGNRIRIEIPVFSLNHKPFTPDPDIQTLDKRITCGNRNHPDLFRVLQWNIWHGGVHLGKEGGARIIELIKATGADLVTMQEGYGFQQQIAEATGYGMQTASLKDNLVIFSRYPFTALPSSDSFCSNPVKVELPGGRPLLVNGCWLPYSYRPDYTGGFPNPGQDPDVWIAEDSIRPMAKANQILANDLFPYEEEGRIPIIMAGDFNSCSHLDWTLRAAPLHYGYGPVSFPTSRFMYQKGFTDSFRELHPDETVRPEGTFAGIYGQLANNRIDFIYYKGKQLRAVSSKIIRTSPEIDDVWASDHSAVLTTFEYVSSDSE